MFDGCRPRLPGPPSRRPILLVVLVLAVAVGLWATWPPWRGPSTGLPPLPTRYRNARPGVDFVGDATCAKCHSDIAATYHRHPMGRSLIPIAEAPEDLLGEAEPREVFEAGGFRYAIERRDGRTIHRETRRDEQGRVIGEVEGEVRYVLGSGRLGRTFVIQRDDFLFESPITWYSQKERWDLSPGYELRDDRFDRQLAPECLTCHTNRFDHVAGTEGHYRPPIFRGLAIGCDAATGRASSTSESRWRRRTKAPRSSTRATCRRPSGMTSATSAT